MTWTVAPPPDFSAAGPLAEVARAFTDHITIECRRAWSAPGSALVVSTDGTLKARGFPAARFEPDGLRALLIHYNDDFPRAAPVLSKLTAATFAAVWRELFDPTDEPVKVDGGDSLATYADHTYLTGYLACAMCATIYNRV